jgi:hypothetical protein
VCRPSVAPWVETSAHHQSMYVDYPQMLDKHRRITYRHTVLGLSVELGRSSKSWVPHQPNPMFDLITKYKIVSDVAQQTQSIHECYPGIMLGLNYLVDADSILASLRRRKICTAEFDDFIESASNLCLLVYRFIICRCPSDIDRLKSRGIVGRCIVDVRLTIHRHRIFVG